MMRICAMIEDIIYHTYLGGFSVSEKSFIVRLFPLLGHKNIDVRKEVLAGITTFLTMAYIIAVNPNILAAAGMDAGALVTATCLSAALGCFLMGFLADLPFALASGMGLNAFFAFTVVIGDGIPWEVALSAIFIEGIIFIFLTLFKIRETVVNSIPLSMKYAVTCGIGLFIAFIGLQSAQVVTRNEATIISMNDFGAPALIATTGLIIIAVLNKLNIRGSILIGILGSSLLAWGYAILNPAHAQELGIFLPTGIFKFESIAPIAGKISFDIAPDMMWNFIVVVLTFLFVDFFDTVGTLVGVSSKAGMLDEQGRVPRAGRALMSDAIATTAGAALGVSTVTTFVESATGVSEGGRTGLTAVTVGFLFLIAMFFSPIFIAIPACATAPALIYVGYLMLTSVKEIPLDTITDGVPAFITLVAMPMTYSIGNGLTLGILSYVIINLVANAFSPKEARNPVSPVMIGLAILFALKLTFM